MDQLSLVDPDVWISLFSRVAVPEEQRNRRYRDDLEFFLDDSTTVHTPAL